MGRIFILATEKNLDLEQLKLIFQHARGIGWPVTAIDVVNQDLAAKLERYKVFLQDESRDFTNSMRQDAVKYLDYIVRIGRESGLAIDTALLEGEPYEKITEYIMACTDLPRVLLLTRKGRGEQFKDIFTNLERRLLLQADFAVMVAGVSR